MNSTKRLYARTTIYKHEIKCIAIQWHQLSIKLKMQRIHKHII